MGTQHQPRNIINDKRRITLTMIRRRGGGGLRLRLRLRRTTQAKRWHQHRGRPRRRRRLRLRLLRLRARRRVRVEGQQVPWGRRFHWLRRLRRRFDWRGLFGWRPRRRRNRIIRLLLCRRITHLRLRRRRRADRVDRRRRRRRLHPVVLRHRSGRRRRRITEPASAAHGLLAEDPRRLVKAPSCLRSMLRSHGWSERRNHPDNTDKEHQNSTAKYNIEGNPLRHPI